MNPDTADSGSEWFDTRATRIVHDGHVTLRIDTVAMPDGSLAHREVASPPDAVAIVAILEGDVVLVRQHRQPVGATLLELPAGVLDTAEESPLDAAARELAEEVGLAADHLETLVTTWSSPGWSTERVTLVHATGLRATTPPVGFVREAEEASMEVVRLPLSEAVQAVHDGAITDAKTVVGLLLVAGSTS